MNDLINAIQNLIPHKFQPLSLAILVLLPRGLYAWRNGGGPKEFLAAMFLGTNTPATPPATGPAPGVKVPTIVLIAAASLALTVAGCSTGAQTAVYNSATAVQTTVETVMTAYGNLVKTGVVSDAQRAQVAQAYAKYQIAMSALIDAESALGTLSAGSNTNAIQAAQGQQTTASAQVNQALQDLVTLVQSFGVKL